MKETWYERTGGYIVAILGLVVIAIALGSVFGALIASILS